MNLEVKAQWVTDLRSGEYRQGRGTLRGPDGALCCLGVLCEQAVRAGVVTRADYEDECSRYADAQGNGNCELLPDAVQAWAGLSTDNPVVRNRGSLCLLTSLNDIDQAAFDEIADLIEAQL